MSKKRFTRAKMTLYDAIMTIVIAVVILYAVFTAIIEEHYKRVEVQIARGQN